MTPWLPIVGLGEDGLDGAMDLWRDSLAGALAAAAVNARATDDPP